MNKPKHLLALLLILVGSSAFGQQDSLLYSDGKLQIYSSKAISEGRELYNSRKERQRFREAETTEDCPDVIIDIYRNPLSLIEDYFSYEDYVGSESACGVYGDRIRVRTVHTKSLKQVALTDLFEERSILAALKKDKWIKKIGEESGTDFNKIDSFSTFLEVLNRLGPVKFTADSFAVLGYDKGSELIAIRYVGASYMGFNHHEHLQLGLLLKPKPAFGKKLKNKTRFTLGRYKNGLTSE